MAQRTPAEKDHKRRYGDEQGKVHVDCLKRLALGGKVTKQDAMVVGVPVSVLEKQAAPLVGVCNTVESKELDRKAADAAQVGRVAMYTDDEYNHCVVDALKGRLTHNKLCDKYGLSRPTLSRAIKKVKDHLKMAHAVDDRVCMNLLEKCSDDDLLGVLGELRDARVIRSMGGVPLLNDIEVRTVMATVGVMGGCGIGKNEQIHRVKAADSINKMGGNMLAAIGRARERGDEVDDAEEQRACRFKKAKINPKTWEEWRRKYNESGAVGQGTELEKGRKASGL